MKKLLVILFITSAILTSCKDGPDPEPSGSDASIERVSYGSHALQKYDIYLPENRNSETEVVIMVHGGGWVTGYHPNDTVTTFDGRYGWDILNPLLDKGYACVVMKYRTTCYNTVPENFQNRTKFYLNRMHEDIDLVIDDIKSKTSDFNISGTDFHLLGESGGGHIVLSYGVLADGDEHLASVTSMFGPTNIDAQDFKEIIYNLPLIYIPKPNYFLLKSAGCESVTEKQIRTWSSIKSFSDHQDLVVNGNNAFLDSLSPSQEFNIQRNVPMFIQHGEEDELVPVTQADSMYAALENVYGASCLPNDFSCQHKIKKYENCGHGWIGGGCQKNIVMQDIIKFIENH